ncbi:MAG: hypothetical protein IJV05_12095 [Muribaculaceae bacterium]|nr:hypothetical protein [Muribaculaceae bacterium]
MKLFSDHLLILSLLASVGWISATAQSSSATSVSERIALSLVDNKCTYSIDEEKNYYENTLGLKQPTGDNKLTAGMLKEGDNHIVFHRSDGLGNSVDIARINLASVITRQPVYAGQIDFYGDGSNLPSSPITMTQAMLPSDWNTDGSNLVMQTNGYAYITGKGGLTFTVPAGFDNGTLQLVVTTGENKRDGYFSYCLNNGSWYILSTEVTAGETLVIGNFTGINSGDVISLYGGQKNGDSYYSTQSPDIKMIGFNKIPKSLIPTVTVSPAISQWNGTAWSDETVLEGTTYSVNDLIDLEGLGTITDSFSDITADNSHPSGYSYMADYDANVIIPSSSTSGIDFYASADFTAATTANASSALISGANNWTFYGAKIYSPSAGRCCYMMYYGAIMYTMPSNFMGNSVNVSITTNNGDDGAGDLYVNGQVHTFTAGETYTWTVPVRANGAIELKCVSADFSIDFTKIVISSGNGAALGMPNSPIDGQPSSSATIETAYPFDQVKQAHESIIMATEK